MEKATEQQRSVREKADAGVNLPCSCLERDFPTEQQQMQSLCKGSRLWPVVGTVRGSMWLEQRRVEGNGVPQ